ncbi:hypothetical protein VC95412_003826 [Vibrio cholerae O1 str. 95412]|nr:hypothetical protein VC95412_003826 [Vibrio cholerae O1 str. 95412]
MCFWLAFAFRLPTCFFAVILTTLFSPPKTYPNPINLSNCRYFGSVVALAHSYSTKTSSYQPTTKEVVM